MSCWHQLVRLLNVMSRQYEDYLYEYKENTFDAIQSVTNEIKHSILSQTKSKGNVIQLVRVLRNRGAGKFRLQFYT